jgi:hypothetical protein
MGRNDLDEGLSRYEEMRRPATAGFALAALQRGGSLLDEPYER